MAFKLGEVKLRSAPKPVERKAEPLLCDGEEAYKKLMEETFFEEYYDQIKEWTFRSEIFPIQYSTIGALQNAFKIWEQTKTRDVLPGIYEQFPELTQLAQEIDLVANTKLNASEYFIRLSTRSAKDAALYSPVFKQVFDETLEALANEPDSSDENNRLIALYQASTQALCCKSGKDAVDLLITSSRIQGDLTEYGHEGAKPFNVILREWATFKVEHEFRLFAYNNKVTAITQYNEFCYFSRLAREKDEVASHIIDFVNKNLVSKLRLQNFVLDIVLCESSDPSEGKWKVKIVELNPFAEFAGTGLFSWLTDKPVLLGRVPFEFRIQETCPKFAVSNIAESWRPFLWPDQ